MVVVDVEEDDEEDEDVEVDLLDDRKCLGEIFIVVIWFIGISNGDVICIVGDVDGFWVFFGFFGDVVCIFCDVDCLFELVSMLVVFCEGVLNFVLKFCIIVEGKS